MALENRKPEAYNSIANQVRRACFDFPKEDLGNFIINLQQKVERPYLLHNKGAVKLDKISSLEEYIAKLLNSYPGEFRITDKLMSSVIEAAEYWAQHSNKYSKAELIIIEIAQLAVCHCVVLRQRNIAPKADLKYITTIISTGRHVSNDVMYRMW